MKFVVLAIFMVLFFGVFHMVFIVFDYAYNDPDAGAFSLLQDSFNETVEDTDRQDWYNDHQNFYLEFFGIARFGFLALAIIFFIAAAVSKYNEGSSE